MPQPTSSRTSKTSDIHTALPPILPSSNRLIRCFFACRRAFKSVSHFFMRLFCCHNSRHSLDPKRVVPREKTPSVHDRNSKVIREESPTPIPSPPLIPNSMGTDRQKEISKSEPLPKQDLESSISEGLSSFENPLEASPGPTKEAPLPIDSDVSSRSDVSLREEVPLPKGALPHLQSKESDLFDRLIEKVPEEIEEIKDLSISTAPCPPASEVTSESSSDDGLIKKITNIFGSMPSLPSLPSFPTFSNDAEVILPPKPPKEEIPIEEPSFFSILTHWFAPTPSVSQPFQPIVQPPQHDNPLPLPDEAPKPDLEEAPLLEVLPSDLSKEEEPPILSEKSEELPEEEQPAAIAPLPQPVVQEETENLWRTQPHPTYSLEQLELITYLARRIPEDAALGSQEWNQSLGNAWNKNRIRDMSLVSELLQPEGRLLDEVFREILKDPQKVKTTLEQTKALIEARAAMKALIIEARDAMIANGSWREHPTYSPEALELLTYILSFNARISRDEQLQTGDPLRDAIFDSFWASNAFTTSQIIDYLLGCGSDQKSFDAALDAVLENPNEVSEMLAMAKTIKAHIDEHGSFPLPQTNGIEETWKNSHPSYSSEALDLLTYLPEPFIPPDVRTPGLSTSLGNLSFWQTQKMNQLPLWVLYNLMGCMDKKPKEQENLSEILEKRLHEALPQILTNPARIRQLLEGMKEEQSYINQHGYPLCTGPTKNFINAIIAIGLKVTGRFSLMAELPGLYNLIKSSKYLLEVKPEPLSLYSVVLEYSFEERQQMYQNLINVVYPNLKSLAGLISQIAKQEINVKQAILNLLNVVKEEEIENLRHFIDANPAYTEQGITIEILNRWVMKGREKAQKIPIIKEQLERLTEEKKGYPEKIKTASSSKDRKKREQEKKKLVAQEKNCNEEIKRLQLELTDDGMRETIVAIGLFMGIPSDVSLD